MASVMKRVARSIDRGVRKSLWRERDSVQEALAGDNWSDALPVLQKRMQDGDEWLASAIAINKRARPPRTEDQYEVLSIIASARQIRNDIRIRAAIGAAYKAAEVGTTSHIAGALAQLNHLQPGCDKVANNREPLKNRFHLMVSIATVKWHCALVASEPESTGTSLREAATAVSASLTGINSHALHGITLNAVRSLSVLAIAEKAEGRWNAAKHAAQTAKQLIDKAVLATPTTKWSVDHQKAVVLCQLVRWSLGRASAFVQPEIILQNAHRLNDQRGASMLMKNAKKLGWIESRIGNDRLALPHW
jgi:hypothetical protein